MFIDEAKIHIKAGNGGDGAVSFLREKYVANGGPDGGDGGKGGDIVFVADENARTLADLRYLKKYVAEDGEKGGKRNRAGKYGEDTIIKVPLGTILRNAETDQILVDLSTDGQRYVAANGGRGGSGNQHFATSTRQIPTFAKSGIPGESLWISLELKLLAEVGLLGFPNVGKSTILSRISSAKPKIANYHFTTLTPNLGVVKVGKEFEFVVADIPGLIEGAHLGTGLGHEFLRHIERTKLLIHVLDISGSEGRNPEDDFDKINNELKQYNSFLADKPQIIAGNKVDAAQDTEAVKTFITSMEEKGYEVFIISAVTGEGLEPLINRTAQLVKDLPEAEITEVTEEIKVYEARKEAPFTIKQVEDYFVIEGAEMERLVASVDLDNFESLSYFQRRLRVLGVIDALKEAGIKENDTVCIKNFEFNFIE
jgi:GTP-binding protein